MLTDTETVINPKQFKRLCDIVYRHCGITLHDGKQELVRARIARQLRNRPIYNSADEYLESVMSDLGSEEFASLIDALSTNLTSFFRESSHFTYLSQKLLPKILEKKSSQVAPRIRGWSAACSTGEEPYTIAITLLEALGNQRADAKILATDISRNVLRTAKAGVYPAERIKSVLEPMRSRYFQNGVKRPGEVQVAPALKNMVAFNYLNLMEQWPFTGPFDFIFCRNVMIYFDKPTQEKLVNRFYHCLEKGGILFTGHSESLTGISHPFQYVQPTIYLKA